MQNYMFLGLKSPYRTVFSLHSVQTALSAFAILAGLVASGSVFLNDLYFWGQSSHYINQYLCLMAFLLAFSPRVWGLAAIIFLLPLSAGLGTQLNAYLGTQFLILPNAGLDLVAGFFLGSALIEISKVSSFFGKNRAGDPRTLIKDLVPWPIALVIVMITISTAIAISRNVYQSAAATSFKGLLFNLVHFRPIGWHDDYMPISDWIAYALAVAMIILVIGQLRDQENKNQIIFRPIMAGLIIAALMGISQAITGLGLPENLLSFRKDQLGYAVIGFQPDLHAFAGHMLLGAVGLWGYFYSGISKLEKKVVLLTATLCWFGLVLSKSRALLLLGLAALFVWLIWYLWQKKRRFVLPAITLASVLIGLFLVLIYSYSNHLSGIPVLSWLGELANEFKSRDLTSWSLFSGIFGSRFEIWEAAIRMWWEFPLMGIGQGNFYRLSDIASFSKSHFLILNHGENAHNYFLQTLSEVGLVGAAVFLVLIISPFIAHKNLKSSLSVVIAISSLFLGNIFSHSFLVRENLILGAVFFGLWYSICFGLQNKIATIKVRKFLECLMYFIFAVILVFSVRESFKSFGKFPFLKGYYCHIDRGLSADGWISGLYLFDLQKFNNSNEVYIDFLRAKNIKSSVSVTLELLTADLQSITISSKEYDEGSGVLRMVIPSLILADRGGLRARLTISDCFTPRNEGLNGDGRRLGVFIRQSTNN